MRAHLTRPVTDQQGNLLPNVQVTVYEPGTTTPIQEVLYTDGTSSTPQNNPFVTSTGIIDVYLNDPKRVDLAVAQGGTPVVTFRDMDVLAAGADSLHGGAGTGSLVIGSGATAPADQSTAVGTGASSGGVQSTALGAAANSLGNQSIAVGPAAVQGTASIGVGSGAQATGDNSVAIGDNAATGMPQAVALGSGASAPYANSTAVGAGATTTASDQVMLGAPNQVVEIPEGSSYALTSPGGNRFLITVDDDGALITTPA